MANKAKKRASGLRGPLTASSMASFARRLIMGFLFGGKASGWPIFQSVLFLFDPQTTKAQEKIAKPLSLPSRATRRLAGRDAEETHQREACRGRQESGIPVRPHVFSVQPSAPYRTWRSLKMVVLNGVLQHSTSEGRQRTERSRIRSFRC